MWKRAANSGAVSTWPQPAHFLKRPRPTERFSALSVWVGLRSGSATGNRDSSKDRRRLDQAESQRKQQGRISPIRGTLRRVVAWVLAPPELGHGQARGSAP